MESIAISYLVLIVIGLLTFQALKRLQTSITVVRAVVSCRKPPEAIKKENSRLVEGLPKRLN